MRAAADRAALSPLPAVPYLVAEHHLRRVGKDCLVSFEASMYSVPAARIRPLQTVQLRVTPQAVAIHALAGDGGGVLAVHPRAARRGQWVVDETHWDGLPDGHTRATVIEPRPIPVTGAAVHHDEPNPLAASLARSTVGEISVARRDLASYDAVAGLPGTDEPEGAHR